MPVYLRQLIEQKLVELALEQLSLIRVRHPAQFAVIQLHVREKVAEGRAHRDPWCVIDRALRPPRARRPRAA